ncbi:uncharacterized protein LOC110028261 [Phalaenopsis equestris]|uniref:uncharacterized protein LOC110028261 n=1 Tax=Phalaenopsis equestris TaxID=78828 RepID=UPI0009E41883|nr:uncharacterized protein LOC110028261 [Phalaenopsis equestris]
MEKPAPLTDASSSEDRRIYEKWDRSNRLSLMIIKRGIPEAFRGAVSSEITDAASFLAEIEKRFAKSDKAETGILLKKLISMRFSGKESIREYIVEMSNIASKLKLLKLELPDDLLVHLVLISLPPQFGQFLIVQNEGPNHGIRDNNTGDVEGVANGGATRGVSKLPRMKWCPRD